MGAITRDESGRRVLTDSIRRDLELRHVLTEHEAEELFHRVESGEDEASAAEEIKSARRVYRTHVERGYSAEANPLEAAKRRRVWEEAEHLGDAPRPKQDPESGPYGPNTDYTEAATGSVTRKEDLYR